MKELYNLFEAGVQEMYASEKEIVKALPGLIQIANEPKLKEALSHHLEETKEQMVRLEKIAEDLNINLTSNPSTIIHAILQKGQTCTPASCPSEVRDAAIIATAQCVEHHEMAVYGTLKAFACILELDAVEKQLEETLEEEKKADKKLSKIAKDINKKACDEKCE